MTNYLFIKRIIFICGLSTMQRDFCISCFRNNEEIIRIKNSSTQKNEVIFYICDQGTVVNCECYSINGRKFTQMSICAIARCPSAAARCKGVLVSLEETTVFTSSSLQWANARDTPTISDLEIYIHLFIYNFISFINLFIYNFFPQ